MNRSDRAEVMRLARDRLGFAGLRPAQTEAIEALLDGHDVLSVMPTGSGKSAIYQIAAMLLDGPTVVVSPLIALQQDQLAGIEAAELAGAAAVNSTLRAGERRAAFDRLEGGSLEFLFLAPEQFASADTMDRLAAAPPSLFVVDEAHCISEWGHDFRPDYVRLGAVIGSLGRPRVLALTATAAPEVRDEIVQRLGMRRPRVMVRGFERPNIRPAVERCTDDASRRKAIVAAARAARRPGIVYAATRRAVEEIAAALGEAGIAAGFYHAGMKADDRARVQEDFMAGRFEVLAATNAFGMGVDKADVRFVFHAGPPDSPEAYYQEFGRAGRDGGPADAVLFYRPEDIGVRRAMSGVARFKTAEVERVAEALADRAAPADAGELAEETELPEGRIERVLNRLADVGAAEVLAGGGAVAENHIDPGAAAEDAVAEQERHRRFRSGRLEIVRDYAETRACRWNHLLNHFGEPTAGPCGHCDNCEAGTAEAAAAEQTDPSLPFPLKSRVRHRVFGDGTVMRYEADKVVVLFDTEGYHSLVTGYVLEHDLLEPAE